jgi:apolipoprotein N-acyltransferase
MLSNGMSPQLYHKSKLVVGVEDFPYQSVLKPLIGDAMIDLGGTVAMKTTQNYRSVFNTNFTNLRVAPIICYESVYGEFVTEYSRNGANLLAIITNDAWWNNTEGHRQHLSYAKLRAIENRRFVARSANTGISAIIDDTGKILNSLEYDKQGALKGKVKTNSKLTFYAMAGDYIARIAMFVALFVFMIVMFRKKRVKV